MNENRILITTTTTSRHRLLQYTYFNPSILIHFKLKFFASNSVYTRYRRCNYLRRDEFDEFYIKLWMFTVIRNNFQIFYNIGVHVFGRSITYPFILNKITVFVLGFANGVLTRKFSKQQFQKITTLKGNCGIGFYATWNRTLEGYSPRFEDVIMPDGNGNATDAR